MPNQKFLCLQRGQPGQPGKGEKPSPAQMEEMYAQFNAWKEKFRENLVDMGGRLKSGKIVTSEGAMDGPFVEAKEVIGGYMIVSAGKPGEGVGKGPPWPRGGKTRGNNQSK